MIWGAVIDDYKQSVLRKHYSEQGFGAWDDYDKTGLNSPLDFGTHDWNSPRQHDFRDIFDLHSYHEDAPFKGGAMYLRFVSPQAKRELEDTFISMNDFRFSSPKQLDNFLSQLPACQRPLLRSFTLKLSVCAYSWVPIREYTHSEYRAWKAVIERLPATLRFVTFDGTVVRFRPGNRVAGLEGFTAVLEVLSKKVQRRVPRVKISVAGLKKRCKEDREILQSMLDELVPYSEDFKKWSDQSRKNATDEGKLW